jgi:hypothetical protein
MMIKRDRTICDTCGAEVSGWRPWYEPRSFHDYSKHTAQFRAERYPPNDPASAAASAVIKENADPINAILLTGKKIIPVTSATTPSVSEAMTSSAATTSATAAATATTTATTVTAATKLG